MRHRISLLAAAGFGVLALGSGESTPATVQTRYEGPTSVQVGEAFPFSVHVRNDGDAPITLDHVITPGDVTRAFAPAVEGVTEVEDYGDGTRWPIAPVTIAPGTEVKVVDMAATPHLRGGAPLEVCETDGTCHVLRLSPRVQGGAEHAVVVDWAVPDTVVPGERFEIVGTFRNVSGGDDVVESAGFKGATMESLELHASEPPDQGIADELMREVWRYDLALGPGEEATLRWTVSLVPGALGPHVLTHCLASETFCVDQAVPLQVARP